MILSKVQFAIRGSNRTRLLNKLKEQNITIYNLQTQADTTFWVSEKFAKNVKELADILAVQYDIVDCSGVRKIIKKVLKNAPYIVAVTICISIIASSMLFVFDTKVVSENDVTAKKVEILLNENNLDGTLPKSKVDLRQIENLIVSSIDEVSFVTCYIKGYYLMVQVVGTEPPNKVEEKSNLISDFDAVVTRVIVRSGTSEVTSGQTVKRGDTLIGGYHIADNTPSDGEESGDRIEVKADGEVYGKVYTHKRFEIPQNPFSFIKTGGTKIVRELSFNKLTVIPGKKVPYEFFEKKTSEIKLFGILPLKVTSYEYFELKKVSIPQNTYIENLKNKFDSEFIASLNLDAKLLSKDYQIKRIDGATFLDIFYETEQRIDNGGNNY